jgi:nucleotide-binding universal stress UspA family protein
MLSISRILLPVAFSEGCRGAAHYAAALARRFGSEVVVLHVAESLRPILDLDSGVVLAETAEYRRAALCRQLDSFFGSQFSGLTANTMLVDGDPATEIVTLAHDERVDLIVMPTHGYGPFRRLLLGSVTAKVLHDVRCPVWTGVHMENAFTPETTEFRNIACAVDLGPQTEATLVWAAGWAVTWNSTLTILHAVPSVSDSGWLKRATEMARDEIAKYQEELKTSAEVHLLSGNPDEAVCEAARRIGADLLVIGRGHGTGEDGRLPSNAYAIVRGAPCPVVSV